MAVSISPGAIKEKSPFQTKQGNFK